MTGFDFTPLLADNLPPAGARWSGFPEHNFVGGHNDRTAIPVEALIQAVTTQLQARGQELATYSLEGGPQGMLQLREFVAKKMIRDRGMPTNPDQVLITSGSLQGLDLVNGVLLNPGDTVIIEEHTYGGMLSKVARFGARIVGAPVDDDGIDVDALRVVLDRLAADGVTPKYIYTIPTVQNPTGSVMPLDRRKDLLALAQERAIPIFEDECYADLVFEGDWPPALRGLDDSGLVIHIGSFSKSLAPAIRLGYMVADWPLMSRMMPLKSDAGTGAVEQMMVAEYFGNHFDAHLEMLKPKLKRKLDTMAEAVEREFGTAAEFTRPKGGIFFWMRIPGVDTSKLNEAALKHDLHFNPGAGWSTADANPRAKESLRLCFALATDDEINRGVAKLAEICRSEFGIPAVSANVQHG
ncbi:MAG: PLP-dependent aminotransferase family protein [Pseudomonadota bacterium]